MDLGVHGQTQISRETNRDSVRPPVTVMAAAGRRGTGEVGGGKEERAVTFDRQVLIAGNVFAPYN